MSEIFIQCRKHCTKHTCKIFCSIMNKLSERFDISMIITCVFLISVTYSYIFYIQSIYKNTVLYISWEFCLFKERSDHPDIVLLWIIHISLNSPSIIGLFVQMFLYCPGDTNWFSVWHVHSFSLHKKNLCVLFSCTANISISTGWWL